MLSLWRCLSGGLAGGLCAEVERGAQVTKIEGVFSGTMSYIFNEFSTGKDGGPSFSSVVRVAREKGYTVRRPHSLPLLSFHATYHSPSLSPIPHPPGPGPGLDVLSSRSRNRTRRTI